MSRATWYRLGKPDKPRARRTTQADIAAVADISLRRLQRSGYIQRHAPDLEPRIMSRELTAGAAIRIIHARQGRPDLPTITISLSLSDKERLAKEAKRLDMPLSVFVQACLHAGLEAFERDD